MSWHWQCARDDDVGASDERKICALCCAVAEVVRARGVGGGQQPVLLVNCDVRRLLCGMAGVERRERM